MGAKIELDPGLDVAEVAAAIDATEARLREAVPIARVVYLEPDVYDPALDDGEHPAPGLGPLDSNA